MRDETVSTDRYAHLRANAAAQKQTTVERLKQAIETLETDGRPVNTFTIKEVSGLNYMSYYRNAEAFQLFQQHSTHLRAEHAKRQAPRSATKRKQAKGRKAPYEVQVKTRDSLLDYKRPRLVALVREAQRERDEAKRHLRTEREEMEHSYHTLLQEHLSCGVTIAKLEAQVAEYLAFMERFRSSLRREEHEPNQ